MNKVDGTSAWSQSRIFGQKADVSIYNVSQFFDEAGVDKSMLEHVFCLNKAPQVRNMSSKVGLDVFVLGFPLGIMKTAIFPIWKRASIATEYDFDVNGMPSFLIDTATREGMSGAPVIQRASSYETREGTIAFGPAVTQVLGVYSGRYIGELDEAQLGIVWKTELIEQIIGDPSPGDFTLDQL